MIIIASKPSPGYFKNMVINDDIWFLNESYAQDFYREARINNKGIKIYFGENKEELIPPGEYETE